MWEKMAHIAELLQNCCAIIAQYHIAIVIFSVSYVLHKIILEKMWEKRAHIAELLQNYCAILVQLLHV